MSRGSTSGAKAGGKSADPKQAELDELEAKYRKMILGAKMKYPLAADNLEYWLSKKGGTRSVPSKHFSSDKKVLEHLRKVHRAVFLSDKDRSKGIVPRIKKDKKEGKLYDMTWEDSMYSTYNTELFYALGGFTLVSKVKVKVVKLETDTAEVEFKSWKCTAKDVYNWDVGKSAKIPFFGNIADADAVKLEKAGRAKSFKIQSATWDVKDREAIKKATVKLK